MKNRTDKTIGTNEKTARTMANCGLFLGNNSDLNCQACDCTSDELCLACFKAIYTENKK